MITTTVTAITINNNMNNIALLAVSFHPTTTTSPMSSLSLCYASDDRYDVTVNPSVTHAFQSAAMRFGHTLVPPGVWRR